jgi:GT2 family glycosyltransferase
MEAHPSLVVISAPSLPDGWTGKNNAMSAGTKIAKGKWLLFTDADTVHKPGSLARAVAEAEQHGAALLSYSPEQEVGGFWEKAVMPVIFAELAATYPPKKVNDPASPIAAANGQYLMISRSAYDAVRGHTKIAGDLLEDVAMARLVKSSGRKIFFRYGGDAVRTRMYRSWSQMKEGWTKNLALLFKHPMDLAWGRVGELVMLLSAPWIILRALLFLGNHGFTRNAWFRWYNVLAGILILVWIEFVRRINSAHFRGEYVFSSILGLPIFSYLLVQSDRSYKNAHVEWKDRTYVYSKREIEVLRNHIAGQEEARRNLSS